MAKKRNDAIIVPGALVETFVQMFDANGVSMASQMIKAYFDYWRNGTKPQQSDAVYWLMIPYIQDADRLLGIERAKSNRAREAAYNRWKNNDANAHNDDANAHNDDANAHDNDANAHDNDANAQKTMLLIQDNIIQDNTTPPIPPKGSGGGVDFGSFGSVSKWLESSKRIKDEALAKEYVSFIADREAEGNPIKSPTAYFDKWYLNCYMPVHQKQQEQAPPEKKHTVEERQMAYELWCKEKQCNANDPNSTNAFIEMLNKHDEYNIIEKLLNNTNN